MTFLDPGARTPVNIEVRFPSGQQGFDPDALPEWKAPDQGKSAAPEHFDADALPDWKPTDKPPASDVGTLGAAGRGAVEAGSFGFAPALAGLREAAGKDVGELADQPMPQAIGLGIKHTVGAARLLADAIGAHSDPAVRAAYERGRRPRKRISAWRRKRTRGAYLPDSSARHSRRRSRAGRRRWARCAAARGAVVGAGAGALGGAGEALSEGAGVPGMASRALTSGAIGAATGGALGGILGPRVARLPRHPASEPPKLLPISARHFLAASRPTTPRSRPPRPSYAACRLSALASAIASTRQPQQPASGSRTSPGRWPAGRPIARPPMR